jgi:GntR family transcriptional regulator
MWCKRLCELHANTVSTRPAVNCQDAESGKSRASLWSDHHGEHADINELPRENSFVMKKYNIQPDTPAYIYETMANHLAARIESGELRPNRPLPAERQLANAYGVSLGTARRATEILRQRGLVVTLRSMGTYVTAPDKRPQQPGNAATVHSITAVQEYRGSEDVSASDKHRSLSDGQDRGEMYG